MLSWADRTMRQGAGSLWWAVRLLMPAAGARVFIQTYSYFRWADDIVDAPDRDPVMVRLFVQRQLQLVEDALRGAPVVVSCPAEAALLSAIQARPGCPRLASSIRTMWQALAFDSRRDDTPITAAALELQIMRVGDAYTEALLACLEITAVPDRLWALARAATAVHHLRDLALDRTLGYRNLPIEGALEHGLSLDAVDLAAAAPYARQRAVQIAALFAEGQPALSGLPWRGRALFSGLAWKYRRLLERLVAPLQAQRFALRSRPVPGVAG